MTTKLCDRCYGNVNVAFPNVSIDVYNIPDPGNMGGIEVTCPHCGLTGETIDHDGWGDDVDDFFDVVWVDPDTGENWKT